MSPCGLGRMAIAVLPQPGEAEPARGAHRKLPPLRGVRSLPARPRPLRRDTLPRCLGGAGLWMVSGQAPRHGKQGFRVIPTEVAASARQDLTSARAREMRGSALCHPRNLAQGESPGDTRIRKMCCGLSRNLSLFLVWDLQQSRFWLRPAPAPIRICFLLECAGVDGTAS